MVKQQSGGLTFELSDLLTLPDHNSHFYLRQPCLILSRMAVCGGSDAALVHGGELAAD